jgi:hypothetical protein
LRTKSSNIDFQKNLNSFIHYKLPKMKNILLLGVLMIAAFQLQAQEPACIPDTTFRMADAGVYPLPVSAEFPDQGITDSACFNQPFNFVFTVVTPDTISIPIFPGVPPISTPLDSITVAVEGAIGGLPEGIDYACNPPNCVFTPENTIGCIVLFGTTTNEEEIGDNPLSIEATVFLPAFSLPINFPDSTLFPGSYSLHVLGADAPQCISTGVNELSSISGFSISPNPNNGRAEIQIESLKSGPFALETFNILGERVQHRAVRLFEGSNRLYFDGQDLSEGIYIVSLSNGVSRISQRVVISR